MAEAANTREARRRRRILQQGSDRLAFITGRIETLPQPDSDPDPASSSSIVSDHPTTTTTTTTLPPLPPPTVLPRSEPEEEDSNPVLQNHVAASESVIQTHPTFENEISSVPSSEIEPEHEPVQVENLAAPFLDSSYLESSHYQNPQEREQRFTIIPSDISSAINSSTKTRFFCSIIMALWVIASYMGLFSLLGIHLVKSVVIGFGPIYLVLLTNWSVVAAKLFAGRQRGFGRLSRRGNSEASDSSADWGSQLAKALEIGLLVQSVLDAVFMDCAVYAIVLVCGLSLLRT